MAFAEPRNSLYFLIGFIYEVVNYGCFSYEASVMEASVTTRQRRQRRFQVIQTPSEHIHIENNLCGSPSSLEASCLQAYRPPGQLVGRLAACFVWRLGGREPRKNTSEIQGLLEILLSRGWEKPRNVSGNNKEK